MLCARKKHGITILYPLKRQCICLFPVDGHTTTFFLHWVKDKVMTLWWPPGYLRNAGSVLGATGWHMQGEEPLFFSQGHQQSWVQIILLDKCQLWFFCWQNIQNVVCLSHFALFGASPFSFFIFVILTEKSILFVINKIFSIYICMCVCICTYVCVYICMYVPPH